MEFETADAAGAANQLRVARAGMIDGALINLYLAEIGWARDHLYLNQSFLADYRVDHVRRSLSEAAVKVTSASQIPAALADILLYLSGDAIAVDDDQTAASLLEPLVGMGMARVFYLQAICFARRGDEQNALRHFKSAANTAPLFGSANRQQGFVHLRQGNVTEAARCFESAIALRDPPWEIIEEITDAPRLVTRIDEKCEIYLYRGRYYPIPVSRRYMGVRLMRGRLYIVEETFVYRAYRRAKRGWRAGHVLASRLLGPSRCFVRDQLARCRTVANLLGAHLRKAIPLHVLAHSARKVVSALGLVKILRRRRNSDNTRPRAQPVWRKFARMALETSYQFVLLLTRPLARSPSVQTVLDAFLSAIARPASMSTTTLPEALDLVASVGQHTRHTREDLARNLLMRPVSLLLRRPAL